jgi:ABC-type transport system involved in multi-copper enzyme maturation permease subunit
MAWAILALASLNFLFHSAIIYFVAQFSTVLSQGNARVPPLLRAFLFTGSGTSYRDFLFAQSVAVMMLLSIGGAILVGNDFRYRSLSFYLARPIGRREYFLGKLGAVSGLALLVTLVPTLALYLEYGLFTESFDYFRDNLRILWAILATGTLLGVSSGVILLGVAALLERTVLVLLVWGGIFVFLPLAAEVLADASRGVWQWHLLNLWAVLRWIADAAFGVDTHGDAATRLPWAIGVLALWIGLSFLAFVRKVRAVEVVR